MRIRLLITVLLGICPALALAERADSDTAGKTGHFGGLDANVDGSVSRDEMDADLGLKPHFSEMDTNHDGGISTGEFSKFE